MKSTHLLLSAARVLKIGNRRLTKERFIEDSSLALVPVGISLDIDTEMDILMAEVLLAARRKAG